MPRVKIEKKKPVGRPEIDPGLRLVCVSFRVDPQVKKELVKMATKRGTSVSVIANGILMDALI